MSDDDEYYPEGIDRAEFDAMVAGEMARMEREARDDMQEERDVPAVDTGYGAETGAGRGYPLGRGQGRGQPAASPEPARLVPPARGSSNLPQPPVAQSPRDLKRAKQEEYAQQLRQDQASREGSRGAAPAPPRRAAAAEEDGRRQASRGAGGAQGKPTLDVFGNASKLPSRPVSQAGLSAGQGQRDKADRQREYAAQLGADSSRRAMLSGRDEGEDPRQRPSSGGGGGRRQSAPPEEEEDAGGLTFGGEGSNRHDRGARRQQPTATAAGSGLYGGPSGAMSKAEKQQDYARQLEADMCVRDRAAAERGGGDSPRKQGRPSSGGGGGRRQSGPPEEEEDAGGLMFGGEGSNRHDRGARRHQQDREQGGGGGSSLQLGGYGMDAQSERDTNTHTHRDRDTHRQQQKHGEYSAEVPAAAPQAAKPSLGEERRSRLLAEQHDSRSASNSLSMGMGMAGAAEQRRAPEPQAAAGPGRKAFPRRDVEAGEHPLGEGGQGGLFGQGQGQGQQTGDARAHRRVAQEQYSQQLRADKGDSGGDSGGGGGAVIREPNLNLGRGYSGGGVGSPGQGQGQGQGSRERDSQAILAARGRGHVGQDAGKYAPPPALGAYSSADIRQSEVYQAAEGIDTFRPVVASGRVRDYKDRQAAYAQALAADASERDSARAGNGMGDQSSSAAQQQRRATSAGRLRSGRGEVDYAGSQGTGLLIGGMDIGASQRKEKKILQQQQYAQDIASANSAESIPSSYRSVIRENTEYMGNGLPGASVPARDQAGSRYHNDNDMAPYASARGSAPKQQQQQQQPPGHLMRGRSTGGGRSQIHF
jgi:hypothetical protein